MAKALLKCDAFNGDSKYFQKPKGQVVLKVLSVIIHALGAVCFGCALYAHPGNSGDVPEHLAENEIFRALNEYPGKWKYLTIWDVVLQLAYHCIGLLNDFCGSSEVDASKQKLLQKFRDGIFASWAFPIGLFVSSSFWGLYAIDRNLVFPEGVDQFIPSWMNHVVHTAPAALLFLELVTTPKIQPDRCVGVLTNLSFMLVYIGWSCWIYTQNGSWVYPILNIMNGFGRKAFFGGSLLLGVGFYFLGEWLTRMRWGPKTHDELRLSTFSKGLLP